MTLYHSGKDFTLRKYDNDGWLIKFEMLPLVSRMRMAYMRKQTFEVLYRLETKCDRDLDGAITVARLFSMSPAQG
jgi:hypothetical protein